MSLPPLPSPSPTPPLITELPLIRRRAKQNEHVDDSFRDYVKGHLPLSNDELDQLVKETTDAVWAGIDCTSCANCCRLEIVVDEKDIRRLATRFGRTADDFARQYVAQDADGTLYFKGTPCPFLGTDNRCTVYEDRPRACRDYPYLYAPHFRSRTLTFLENVPTCPIIFNVWERLKIRFGGPTPPPPRRRKRPK